MPRIVGPVDPSAPIDINVSGMSPHVVAYKLWWRDATTTNWTVIGEGSTGDQQPDHCQHAFTLGSQLYYWIGVGGKANSNYQAIITLSQGGKVLPSGLIDFSGQTNAKGVDTQEDWASFV
jgi:hypothetical protein